MMQEKNNQSSTGNENTLLSVFYLTLSWVNLQDIYRLQWLREYEMRGYVFLIRGSIHRIVVETWQKTSFRGLIRHACSDPIPVVSLLRGEVRGISNSSCTWASISPSSSSYFQDQSTPIQKDPSCSSSKLFYNLKNGWKIRIMLQLALDLLIICKIPKRDLLVTYLT